MDALVSTSLLGTIVRISGSDEDYLVVAVFVDPNTGGAAVYSPRLRVLLRDSAGRQDERLATDVIFQRTAPARDVELGRPNG
jgi:hypothetical protein